MTRTLRLSLIYTLCLLSTLACGGGGGGGSSSGGDGPDTGGGLNPAVDFFVSGAAIARPLFGPDGNLLASQPLVNPASLAEVDPNTGVLLAGFPKVLNPGTSLADLATVNLAQLTDPITPQIPLVPRNAAIVVEFTREVDRATLNLDDSDPEAPGQITSASTIQVRNKEGVLQPARAFVLGKRVVVVGVTPTTLGFVASPLIFSPTGTGVEDPEGFLRVVFGVGTGTLASTDAVAFKKTPELDGLLPFNPGNGLLDAVLLQTETGAEGFNGFLPDVTAPRIVREVNLSGTLSAIDAAATPDGPTFELSDGTLPVLPNVLANGGLGEWAGARITITSAGGVVSNLIVATNFNQVGTAVYQLEPNSTLPPAVQVGDTYTLSRTEFYEPIPGPLPEDPDALAAVTVDAAQAPRDPNDPQDQFNSDLRYFLRVFDEAGVERLDQWNPATGTFLAVPPKSSLQLQFSESMDVSSFRPYETFFVTDGSLPVTDPGFRSMRLGKVEGSVAGNIIRFMPVLEDQLDGSSEFVGFGGTASNLSLVLRTAPSDSTIAALKDSLNAANLAKLRDLEFLGVNSITDLGGRGLGLPNALLDESDTDNFMLVASSAGRGAFPPALDFRLDFQTQASADPDVRAIVHRFMGQAVTSVFTPPAGSTGPVDTVTEGVEYADFPPIDLGSDGIIDRRFIYGPRTLEVGLNAPGRLTGGPAAVIEHLIDNFNAPAPGSFTNPLGEDFLLAVGFGTRVPLNSPFGARMQHVYRATDASPSKSDFQGVSLDLVGLAWSPFNNSVTPSTLDGFGIVVGLSGAGRGLGPSTNQTAGIPVSGGNTGLRRQFDCNWLEYNEDCFGCDPDGPVNTALTNFVEGQPPHTFTVKRTTPYTMLANNLFKPLAAGGLQTGFNLFLNYPAFNTGLDPFFNRDDIFAYPYDSRFPMLVEYRLRPNAVTPSNLNLYRFGPGLLTSVLPRFRTFSQGQDPLAACIPNWTQEIGLNAPPPFGGTNPVSYNLLGGEGGPLLEPGTFPADVLPPSVGEGGNNGMLVIPAEDYILPPRLPEDCGNPGGNNLQPAGPLPKGMLYNGPAMPLDPDEGCFIQFPMCRENPNANFYFASGNLAYPLPNTQAFPGPQGTPATFWRGYGTLPAMMGGAESVASPGIADPPCLIPAAMSGPNIAGFGALEPGLTPAPQTYGENSRYYMLWKYRKRVSVVESPTLEIELGAGEAVVFSRPVIQPPLDVAAGDGDLKIEFLAGPELDFASPAFASGYIDATDEDFVDLLSGDGSLDRNFVKFRASFGVAPNSVFAPTIDTVVIPYRKVSQ